MKSPSSSSSGAIAAIVVVLILVVSNSSSSEASISCSDVISDLKPCLSYLTSSSGMSSQPPAACCSGAKALASAASTKKDKKTACNCIKTSSKNLKINSQLAQALPGNCGISLPISVSPNADCTKFG